MAVKEETKNKEAKSKISHPEAKKAIPLPGEKKEKQHVQKETSAGKKETTAARKIKLPRIRKQKPETKAAEKMADPYSILRFVLMTEKAVRMVEAQNKLLFIVDRRADKQQIKNAAESAFASAISKVNTSIDQKGRKRAYIKFEKPGQAGDIAVRLGII